MANGNDDQNFVGHRLESLIGGPLAAATQAQAMLAQSTINFIKTVGYADDGELEYFDFRFERPVAEWFESSTDQGGKTIVTPPTEIVEIRIPRLGMVSIPNLQIDTLDIAFNIELTAVDEKDDPEGQDVKLYGLPSAHRENTRPTDKTSKYSVQLHVVDRGIPEPLARVIDLLAASVGPTKVSKKGTTSKTLKS